MFTHWLTNASGYTTLTQYKSISITKCTQYCNQKEVT